ncbi:MAG TPA: transcription termination/antitermination NusG family protein [Rhodothermales bacterium]|nr:transcription termination/antitermination NusG family protein [Rhodothermales bacterium]
MPILSREVDAHPERLFELPLDEFPWHVAHVRSRQEKRIARRLREEDIPFYLPQWEQKKRRNSRNLSSWLPLFPGYVFFRGGREARTEALRSNVIARLLEVHDQVLLHEELAQLHHIQASGAVLIPWPEVAAGDEVRICEGLFCGYRGVVLREKGLVRLVVSITALRQSVSVELGREVVALESRPATGRSKRSSS